MKPLTFAEIKSTGIEVNNYISSDNSGKIAFYTSETCSSDSNKTGCSQLYADSTVKKVLDKWAESLSSSTANDITPTSDIKTSDKVGVENTLLSKSIIPIIVGLFLVGVGTTIYTLTVKKKR